MKLKTVLTAALLLAPTAALAAPGIVTVSTGLRAGPGPGFPLVDRIPGGSRVNVHGCLKGHVWCDVSWSDDRGWVSSRYLEYLYRNKYVYLPDYVDVIDAPVVPFVLSSYWSSYYSGRPWYQRRAYWSSYWTSHERFATRMAIDRSAARIGRAATRDAAIAEGRTSRAGVAERVTRAQGAAQIRGAGAAQGRAAAAQARMAHEQARGVHENGAVRANARVQPMAHARMQPPTARAHEAPRISAAPAARPAMSHVAQPKVSHGSPMNAHAQVPAPRAPPAMPRAGGGGPTGGHGHERH
jgi:uncharacterized protein YraI